MSSTFSATIANLPQNRAEVWGNIFGIQKLYSAFFTVELLACVLVEYEDDRTTGAESRRKCLVPR
jgi:hypothetical protein